MKKWIALWSALLMMISILPVMPVSAEEVSALEQAKLCIDTILTAAPAPEDYTFSEELADEVDKLGKLLQTGLSTSEIDTLDAYVATKTTSEVPGEDETTTETVTRYQSVQKFYQDYADAQNAALEELAAPIHTAVDAMLARPLTRENYKTASESYANASAHIKAAVDADDVNALNQIRELLELVDSADRAFLRIEMLKADASAGDYNLFLEDVQSAKTAYGLYESKFAELRRYTKYADCLIKAMKNSLFENYEKYEKANIIADVEQAYDDLGVYDVLDNTVKEKLDVLQDAVDAGAASNFSLSVYDYYRGEAIQYVLTQYRNIETFEEMIALTSETPKNKTELTAALRAYRYYNQELTADEQDLVAPELVKKMNNAVLLNTNCEEVKKQITDIGTAASDDEFEDFTKRYEQAYKSYRLFVNSYSGICDISDLISNLSTLDEATDRLEMLKSIRQIEETEDALMCSKKLQIESLLNAYASLDEDKQAAIYNIDSLREINADVQVASALRIQVDTLRSGEGGYSLLDEDTVKKLRADYEQMTDRQKNLFADVVVDRVRLFRGKKMMCVELKSSHIIPYREIRLIRHNLEAVMGPVGFDVKVDDHYNLSEQYRPEDFWKEYQDSVLDILKEDNILDFNILYRGQIRMEGSVLSVSCEDDSMYRARQDKLIHKLQDIFARKAGFDIDVVVEYTEPPSLEAPSKEYEYVRLENRPASPKAQASGKLHPRWTYLHRENQISFLSSFPDELF